MRPLKLFSIILLSVCSLFLSAGSGFCFTTDNVTVTRSTDKDVTAPGTSVTVTVNVTNLEPDSLRGFYYAEEIPEGLEVNTVSLKVNGSSISDYLLESGGVLGSHRMTLPRFYNNSVNTSGFCSAIRNKASAGPLGLRRPCSQS